jgi:uncharacterized protein YjiS (DUF1127 family)
LQQIGIVHSQKQTHLNPNDARQSRRTNKRQGTTMAFSTETLRGPGLLSGLRDSVARLLEALQRRRVYNRTFAELNRLSTRELEDLGISRCMISRLAHEAAYGKAA